MNVSIPLETNEKEELRNKIITKNAVVAVIGLGYVGLPNVVSKAREGYKVIGFDVDENKIDHINSGISYIGDVENEELSKFVNSGLIHATNQPEDLNLADIITICVPTPIDEYKQPNLKFIKSAVNTIINNVKIGSLIILESTTYPGTTEEYIVFPLEKEGYKIGEKIFVAYSPERIDPSNPIFNVDNTPRVVGGHTESCLDVASDFLGNGVKKVSSTKAAEMAKVYENTFRYVNIALANELTLISDLMDIDAYEVIEAASTKPFGFMPFFPSAGVGGHCIPVDPYYLSYKAKQYDYSAKMIELAGELDTKMKEHTLNKLMRILNMQSKSINNSKIAILGITYKKDVADVRESSIYKLLSSFEKLQADVTLFDPYISTLKTKSKEYNIHYLHDDYKILQEFDIVMVLTDHSDFDFESVFSHSKVIFDTKNIYKSPEIDGVYYKL